MSELDELFADFEARKTAKSKQRKPGAPRAQVNYIDFPENEPVKIRIVQLPNQKAYEKFLRYYIGKFNYPGFKGESVWDGKTKKVSFVAYYEGNPIEQVRLHILKDRSNHQFKSEKYEELDKLAYSVKPRDCYAFVAIQRKNGELGVAKVNASFMDELTAKIKKPKYGVAWDAKKGWDMEVTNKGRGNFTVEFDDHVELTTEEFDKLAKYDYQLDCWKNEATPEYYQKKGISFTPQETVKYVAPQTKEKASSNLEPLTESLEDFPFSDDTPF